MVIELGNPPGAQSSAEAMIQVENLTKLYGLTQAVNGISFSVKKGEILGFLGPNGAGKTTTMRIMTCYTPATSGKVRIGGFDTHTQSQEVRRIVGYLPENAPLYEDMEVRAFLHFMAEVKRYPASRRRAMVDEAIQECNLESVVGRMIRNLSKGFHQRIGLAQALLGDPQVLVLDEPTVGLDPRQIAEIRNLIRSMAGRRTVILSTHILPEVSMTCQKVVIINRGRIEAEGTPEALTMRLGGGSVIMATVQGSFASVQEMLGRVRGVAAVSRERELGPETAAYRIETQPSMDPRAELAKAIIQNGLSLLEMQSSGMTLEDIFLRIISRQELTAHDVKEVA